MVTASRVAGAVALILLLVLATWGGVLHFSWNATNTTGDIVSPAERNKQELLDGLAEGRILYYKTESYKTDRIIPGIADPPEQLVVETWLQQGPGERDELSVATMRDMDGRLLQYLRVSEGKQTMTFPSTGETMEMSFDWYSPTEWVEETWIFPRYLGTNPGTELIGAGELNGRTSLIYEARSRSRRTRIELVEDAPLLRRDSIYRIGIDGGETLTEDETIVEYRLLPTDSRVPSPP